VGLLHDITHAISACIGGFGELGEVFLGLWTEWPLKIVAKTEVLINVTDIQSLKRLNHLIDVGSLVLKYYTI